MTKLSHGPGVLSYDDLQNREPNGLFVPDRMSISLVRLITTSLGFLTKLVWSNTLRDFRGFSIQRDTGVGNVNPTST
jgi:hypothetical protein